MDSVDNRFIQCALCDVTSDSVPNARFFKYKGLDVCQGCYPTEMSQMRVIERLFF